ncbi:hypothetical protein M427DRAFT_149681 [Gonapodya prolifera JEL478]|uniref:EF-hand domain-containing protein n=1 Tax=Gonapodya prolifera (strain JEL478) TaxID=1344416 RepID=A0A138ZYI3_GONPJ|nr:hypothetical protein M427DRAFT_149681 [Gonapodya prolifera JEL478]|eukprot:KXS09559.1 hypothetical protein M427DRAFT_149681 [Gonapodya prolifera JEL478]
MASPSKALEEELALASLAIVGDRDRNDTSTEDFDPIAQRKFRTIGASATDSSDEKLTMRLGAQPNEEKEEEFNWDKNSEGDPEHAEETGDDEIEGDELCFPFWHRLSTLGQWLFVNTILVLILLPIALISKYAFAEETQISHVALSLWCLFVGITILSLGVCRSLVYLAIELWKWRMKRLRYLERVQLVESLQGWVTLAMWSLVNYGIWIWILQTQVCKNAALNKDDACSPNYTLTRIFLGVVFSAIAFFFKSYAFHSFVRSFHEVAFRERITNLRFAENVLDTLREARKRAKPKAPTLTGTESATVITLEGLDLATSLPKKESVDAPPKALNTSLGNPVTKLREDRTLRPLYKTFLPAVDLDLVKLTGDLVLDDTGKSTSGASSSGIAKVDAERDEARKLARKIFEWLCPEDKPEISVEQFYRVFNKPGVAKKAFAIFDTNGQGGISAREMRSSVVNIFEERRNLSKSISDMHKALAKLNLVLTVVTVFILLFVWLLVFGVDLSSVFVTLTTLLVISSYFVGSSLSSTFTAVVFLFVTHPYDVGDLIQIQLSGTFFTFTVMEMNILTTTLKKDDGLTAIVPNNILSQNFIYNVRRSAPQSQSISLDVPFDTDVKKVAELREMLKSWVQKERHDYGSSYVLMLDADGAKYTIKLIIGVVHRDNFQDGGKATQRKDKFIHKIKELLKELQILPTTPPPTSEISISKDLQQLLGASVSSR